MTNGNDTTKRNTNIFSQEPEIGKTIDSVHNSGEYSRMDLHKSRLPKIYCFSSGVLLFAKFGIREEVSPSSDFGPVKRDQEDSVSAVLGGDVAFDPGTVLRLITDMNAIKSNTCSLDCNSLDCKGMVCPLYILFLTG